MGLFKRINDVVRGTANLMIDTNQRFETAVADINAGNYTADRLTSDVTSTWLNSFRLLLRFWRPLSDEVLPTIVITTPGATVPGATGITGTGSLLEPVPLGTAVDVTELAFLGWSPATLSPVSNVSQIPTLAMVTPVPATDMDALRQRVTVTLDVPSTAPPPQQGVYQGFVLIGQAPVAIVVARIV